MISKAIKDAVAENKVPTKEYIIKTLAEKYNEPNEASIMRGLIWHDRFRGVFEKRGDGFYICEKDSDDDDILNDPEIRAMWERGEHTCKMFDAPCMVCVKEEVEDETEEEDGEVMILNEFQNKQLQEWVLDHVDD